MDNVFIERLWKSVKYEDVYLKAYSSIAEARKELTNWFDRYNRRRRHQGLDNRTPDEVYWSYAAQGKGCSMNEGGSPLKTCSNLSRIPRPSLP